MLKQYYHDKSFYWLVNGDTLVQFDREFFNKWKPGTELFGCKIRELSKMKPLPFSEGEEAYTNLMQNVTSIK